jgi:hypothetical protein
MKKFTLIQENYDLERFSISRDQFISYRKEVEKILLKELYPDKVKYAEGIPLLGALPCEKSEGRDFSIFHKVNTNVTLMRYFVRTFNINSFQDLVNLVNVKKNDFFIEGGRYFNEIRKILKITEDYGDKNEYIALEYIKQVIKSKLNLEVNPIKSPSGSYDDLINGVDIKFDINGKSFTCQVKPLVSIKESGVEYILVSSGNIKNYKTDYLSFANHKTGECVLFKNKEVRINGTTIIIPQKQRVFA